MALLFLYRKKGGGEGSGDGNYGTLKGAGSYGSIPFQELFKRHVLWLHYFFVNACF